LTDLRRGATALLLFALTLLTTAALGSRLALNFRSNLPAFDLEHDLLVFLDLVRQPSLLLQGLPYALSLLFILVCHEMGHYWACRYYAIDCTPPYFLPAPTFIGTFGAFIRFRSPVKSRRELFDVGIAGPLAGFIAMIPVLGIGLAYSKVLPGIAQQGEVHFGAPLMLRFAELAVFPGVPEQDVYLHPVARAAWVGLLATALNLLPIGQLDGGHLIYAMFGERHRAISTAFIAAIALLGFVYWPWWVWAPIFWFWGRRHFAVFDLEPLGRGRRQLFCVAAAVFILCFIPAPVLYNGGQGIFP